ncbi:MAG: 4Fe-4S binding protein [Proteobacteria bacterium]|nr:4Fe-4S binding protein [Pseudomonadota bacterium]MBU4318429.1 4Fe-4S binding protein [Pseudomonadota bacterium]MBU4472460.1 4Fe-4S binding protein [Pseudomonadota bacterium]MCG2751287.1 4Fe-4S binding protein [Desulfobacteraceae bacterium]
MKHEKFPGMISRSEAGPGDGGRTGSWRVLRPVIDLSHCIPAKTNKKACFTCWLYCPDGVVSKTIPPKIDYEYCKGCGICAEECPSQAISMEEESSFINKEKSQGCI